MVIKDSKLFLDAFKKEAIDQFGSMTKGDYEVLIYHLLNRFSDLKDKSMFDQSIELRIPESKVKKMSYEAKIRYGEYKKEEILEDFLKELQRAKITAVGKNIRFAIQDKFLRTAIQAEVYKNGTFMDGSFNSDVVSINGDALASLLHSLFDDKKIVKQIEKECEKAIRKDAEKVFSWKDLGHSLLSGTAEALPSFLSSVLAPGASVANIANNIMLTINKK